MFRTRHWSTLPALALALALVAGACGDDTDAGEPSGTGDTTPTGGDATSGGDAAARALPDCLNFADLYALTGPESEGFASWGEAAGLASELGSSTELPDEPLTVAGPGEESGTYDTYVELVVEAFNEDRGVDAATRTDYLSSPNDNVIVENLSSAAGSLGWVGFAFYVENRDALDAFAIAAEPGGECVEPDPETIASGAYPLSRPLYIYVNDAEAASNGTLSAYVDRYLGELYDCVSQAGYVALDDDALEETLSTWEATGFSGGDDDGSSLDISGSSTVEPISQCVLQQSGFRGAVEGPGTGDGFQRFCAGETDISDASRAIKEEEAETCATNGVDYTELLVAIDGIAVMTAA